MLLRFKYNNILGSKTHCFHILYPSIWPVLTSIALFLFMSALGFYFHRIDDSSSVLIIGFLCVAYCACGWFNDIIDEATFKGYHTRVVRKGLRLGFLLFVVSETMLFLGFFRAFFDTTLSPDVNSGYMAPPPGVQPIHAIGIPLLNTMLLILSGLSITWAHRGIALGSFKYTLDALIITLCLGILFLYIQLNEYRASNFNFSDGAFACTFFSLTGSHGCHVFVGIILIFVSFIRLVERHFLTNHYLGFVIAIWYWHFVDVIWILLHFIVYYWITVF